MNIEINPLNYIDEDELKELARGVIREKFRATFTDSNIAYYLRMHLINEYIDSDLQERIKSNVKEQASRMELYLSQYDEVKKICREVIADNTELIKKKAIEKMEKDLEDTHDIGYNIQYAIMRLITGEKP